ncbi:GNAT family N-acetyltransferase [Nocardiopsis terrae]
MDKTMETIGSPVVTEIRDLTGTEAGEVSELTRAAYESGDLVPGLPTADGAVAGPEEVRGDLSGGARLWVASTEQGPVGAVRAVPADDGAWEVRRLAVAPWYRRGGTAKLLLRRLEEAAFTAGADRVVLDAVVERGNPAFYARVGYTAVTHFGAEDKPLSEVRMERRPGAAEHGRPAVPGVPGTAVLWWSVAGGTLCEVLPVQGVPGPGAAPRAPFGAGDAILVGADLRPGTAGSGRDQVRDALSEGAARQDGDALAFDSPVHGLSAFRQPRLFHPELLAWWRAPSVRLRPGT